MKTNAAKQRTSSIAKYNESIREEHARLVDQIIALRPAWSREKLLAVGRSFAGFGSEPGLFDILKAIKTADAMERQFANV